MMKKIFSIIAAVLCCSILIAQTPCDAFDVPWLETFTRDATGAVEPEFDRFIRDHKGMWDEDPDYIVPMQDIEEVRSDDVPCTKVIRNGQLIILRDGKRYNVLGGLIQ